MSDRYLSHMLKLGKVKFKRVKSSRRLDVFNPITNKLLAEVKKAKTLGSVRG